MGVVVDVVQMATEEWLVLNRFGVEEIINRASDIHAGYELY